MRHLTHHHVTDDLLRSFRQAVTASPRDPILTLLPLDGSPWSSHQPTPSKPLLILDSSFNPPTLAHHHLALQSLHQLPQTHKLILLHAVANADKPATDPGDLLNRVEMMRRFGGEVEVDGGCGVVLGVTTEGRFVDKARAVSRVWGGEVNWVVGLDTLTRLVDSKYYPGATSPVEVVEALGPLVANGSLVVFGRGDGETVEEFLVRDPAARVLVERGRVKVVEGWEQLMITVGEGSPVSSSAAITPAPSTPLLDWSTFLPDLDASTDPTEAFATALSTSTPSRDQFAQAILNAFHQTFPTAINTPCTPFSPTLHPIVSATGRRVQVTLRSKTFNPTLDPHLPLLHPAPHSPPPSPSVLIGIEVSDHPRGTTRPSPPSSSSSHRLRVSTISSTVVRSVVLRERSWKGVVGVGRVEEVKGVVEVAWRWEVLEGVRRVRGLVGRGVAEFFFAGGVYC
ncbi:hypothetical protein HDU67_010044 [Dinochytrium kinnereticum]|nr:hypothetical protein HDU67_010044 [Dinochytrium kinnereticum]